MKTIKINSLGQISAFAKEILELYPDQKKFALYGEIGAGKTTLVKEICKQLGVTDNVSSPTYSLISEYEGRQHLIRHLDLYRLKNIEEALDINVEECLDDNEYCFIEWPEIIEPLFPPKITYIRISMNEKNERTIIIGTVQK